MATHANGALHARLAFRVASALPLVFVKALCLRETPRLETVDAPVPMAGEVLVRILVSGICNTDIELSRGYMGFQGIPGHEFVGRVESVGEGVSPVWLEKRVVGEINLGCNRCMRCAQDLSRHCATRTVLGILGKQGTHAEYVTLPERNLHLVPDGVSNQRAVFVEPLAAAFEVLEQIHLRGTDRVLVLGDGKLGLLVSHVLSHTGANVSLVGKHAKKLSIAEHFGASIYRVGDAISSDWDLVVEATGSPAGLARALTLLRPRGTLVLKSTFHGAPSVDTAKIVIDEFTIVGSRCGPFTPALRALEKSTIDPTVLIDATYALNEIGEAFEHAQRPGVLKVLVEPSSANS